MCSANETKVTLSLARKSDSSPFQIFVDRVWRLLLSRTAFSLLNHSILTSSVNPSRREWSNFICFVMLSFSALLLRKSWNQCRPGSVRHWRDFPLLAVFQLTGLVVAEQHDTRTVGVFTRVGTFIRALYLCSDECKEKHKIVVYGARMNTFSSVFYSIQKTDRWPWPTETYLIKYFSINDHLQYSQIPEWLKLFTSVLATETTDMW